MRGTALEVATRKNSGRSSLKEAEKALSRRTAEATTAATWETRSELRHEILQLLRKGTTEDEAKSVKKLWKLLEELCVDSLEELQSTPSDDLYGLIRALKDGLTRLPEGSAARRALLKGALVVCGALGEIKLAELFGIGLGFNDGIEILVHCVVSPGWAELTGLSHFVGQGLRHVAANKHNTTGIGDFTRRQLLQPYLRSRHALTEAAPLDALLAEIFFHPSLSKQYTQYLSTNAASILLDQERISTEGKTPSVSQFLEGLAEGAASEVCSVQILPYLWEQFWARLASQGMTSSTGMLTEKRSGFLMAAELMNTVLLTQLQTPEPQRALLELLSGVQRHLLYEPTLDKSFLQLQFLKRLAKKLCTREVCERPLSSRKKRRRLAPVNGSEEAGLKLQICSCLIKIEHRSFSPCMTELLILLGEDAGHALALEICLKLMRAASNARKWTPFVSALLTALADSSQLSSVLKSEAVLELFGQGIAQVPPMEIQNCLEAMVTAIQKQKWDLWTAEVSVVSSVLLSLIDVVVNSVRIHETNALAVSHSLVQWMPPLDALRQARGTSGYSKLLRILHANQLRLEECKALHPLAEGGTSSLEIEALVLEGGLPQEGELQWLLVEGLIRRLRDQSQQKLRQISQSISADGEKVVAALSALMKVMKAEAAKKLWVMLLTEEFVQWVTLCSPSELTEFLSAGLENFQSNAQLFDQLFKDPVASGWPKFTQAWAEAFFASLEKQVASCQLPLANLFNRRSISEQAVLLRAAILGQLHQDCLGESEMLNDVQALWAMVEFGLRLTVFPAAERWRLESFAVVLALQDPSPQCLAYFSLFSLEALQSDAAEESQYYSALLSWTYQLCRTAFYASARECLSSIQAAVFAVMKQVLYSQCMSGNTAFFSPSERGSDKKKPLSKLKSVMAADLVSELMAWSEGSEQDGCFGLLCVAVFVRLCSWLECREQPASLSCLKGSLPAPWPGKLYQRLKQKDRLPDYTQIPLLCQRKVLPYLQAVLSQELDSKEAPWWDLCVGISAGMVVDLSGILDEDVSTGLKSCVAPLLKQIESLALKRNWKELPLCLDRMVLFLHKLCVWMQPDDASDGALLGMVRLQLGLFVKIAETTHPVPDSQSQSFLLMRSLGEISLRDSFSTAPIRTELLKAFSSLLESFTDHQSVSEMLLSSLEAAMTLEMQLGALQFLIVFLQKLRSQMTRSNCKLVGKILNGLNSCFWQGYFRHVLLTLVKKPGAKAVLMPRPEQRGVFCAILCCYFRAFRICHSFSSGLEQKITVELMRRVKRLVQSLYKRTDYAEPEVAMSWFGECCGFLISAVHHQQSQKAAHALFPSFRAALESLLTLLLSWELQIGKQTPLLEQAEVQLGMVYSDTAQSTQFTETLPELLHSFLKVMDTLRTHEFKKHNPLIRYFHSRDPNESHQLDGLSLVKRVWQRVLTVYSSMQRPQLRELESQLALNPYLTAQLTWFERESARFTGHDG